MMISLLTLEEITKELSSMDSDPSMHTTSTYSPTASDYPDNQVPFVAFHIQYIQSHKFIVPEHYLSNLKLMIKKR